MLSSPGFGMAALLSNAAILRLIPTYVNGIIADSPIGSGKTRLMAEYIKALGNIASHTVDRPGDTKGRVDAREAQLKLLQGLSAAGIDPYLFDLMLSNELDRNLKKQFGVAFLLGTIFFTLLSYGVIVANSVFKWGINDTAITALIVETPIQFIGLLYIIARNLFPQPTLTRTVSVTVPKETETPAQA